MNELLDFELPRTPVESPKKQKPKPTKKASKKLTYGAPPKRRRRKKRTTVKQSYTASKAVPNFDIEALDMVRKMLALNEPQRQLVIKIVQGLSK